VLQFAPRFRLVVALGTPPPLPTCPARAPTTAGARPCRPSCRSPLFLKGIEIYVADFKRNAMRVRSTSHFARTYCFLLVLCRVVELHCVFSAIRTTSQSCRIYFIVCLVLLRFSLRSAFNRQTAISLDGPDALCADRRTRFSFLYDDRRTGDRLSPPVGLARRLADGHFAFALQQRYGAPSLAIHADGVGWFFFQRTQASNRSACPRSSCRSVPSPCIAVAVVPATSTAPLRFRRPALRKCDAVAFECGQSVVDSSRIPSAGRDRFYSSVKQVPSLFAAAIIWRTASYFVPLTRCATPGGGGPLLPIS